MQVGIIGVGSMGRVHADSWQKAGLSIRGFLGGMSDRGAKLAAEYGVTLYPDLDALLQAVDVVDICTPTHLHYEMALSSAAAGKHIVCEKPLARTVAQGRAMLAACERHGVKLLMAHVLRFFPEYARIQDRVAGGEIGQPTVLRLFRRSRSPKTTGENWFFDAEKSGGVIMDLMIHDLDYARWVAGDVARVYAQQTGHHAMVMLTHVSGALSYVEASWDYPPPTFWTGVEIKGTEGFIQYDSEAALAAPPDVESPYTLQARAFYHALTADQPMIVSAQDGLAAVQIVEAALESVGRGQSVSLNQASLR